MYFHYLQIRILIKMVPCLNICFLLNGLQYQICKCFEINVNV